MNIEINRTFNNEYTDMLYKYIYMHYTDYSNKSMSISYTHRKLAIKIPWYN